MPGIYDVGDLVRLQATFVSSGGAVGDPSQIWCLLLPPGTTGVSTARYGLTPSAIIRSGIGAYFLDVDVTLEGGYRYRWEGTGNVQAAEESGFEVRQTFKL